MFSYGQLVLSKRGEKKMMDSCCHANIILLFVYGFNLGIISRIKIFILQNLWMLLSKKKDSQTLCVKHCPWAMIFQQVIHVGWSKIPHFDRGNTAPLKPFLCVLNQVAPKWGKPLVISFKSSHKWMPAKCKAQC